MEFSSVWIKSARELLEVPSTWMSDYLWKHLQCIVELRPHFTPNHIKSLPPNKYENRFMLCHYSPAKKLWSLTILVDSTSAHKR